MEDFPPDALVVDSGQLEPCCEVLAKLDRDWLRVPVTDLKGLVWPTELLICTPEGARSLGQVPVEERRDAAWLCVVDARCPASQVDELRRLGVHLLLRRAADGSLDRELLRLLFLQLAYLGAERRGHHRMICCHEVTLAAEVQAARGRHRFTGRLLDLCLRSCRVQSEYTLPRGTDVRLYLPESLDPASTAYPAVVARSRAGEAAGDGVRGSNLILEFRLPAPLRASLEYVLRALAGPGTLATLNEPQRVELSGLEPDRRALDERRSYRQAVCAVGYLDAEAPQLIQARELSDRGLCVEPTAELRVGRAVTVSLHRSAGLPPLLLEATVERDDGGRGLWLAFRELRGPDRDELSALLSALPALEDIARTGRGCSGAVWVGRFTARE